jgi:FMN phosphatase YigB (HAD superfamily)
VKAVAFDAMGVLYRAWDDVASLLIPYARAKGSRVPDADIEGSYRTASLGEMSTQELWLRMGVPGDWRELDRSYLAGHELTPGITGLLDDLAGRGVTLGCISNDVGTWSRELRVMHGLATRVAHWTVSAEVGARKPDKRIFRSFLASTGLSPAATIFVDDRVANVDAALALGFDAVLVDFARVHRDTVPVRTVVDLHKTLLDRLGLASNR